MEKKRKPKRIMVKVMFYVDMNCWDDDVNWSNPKQVIQDQIDCAGLEDVCEFDRCDMLEILVSE